MKEDIDIWMEFCESLRPDLDSVCFYPESMLPIPRMNVIKLLALIYFDAKEGSNQELIHSVAVNVGYLGRFTNLVTEKYMTSLGAISVEAFQNPSGELIESQAFTDLVNSSASDKIKDQELLMKSFSTTLFTFSKNFGFDFNEMILLNGLIGLAANDAIAGYKKNISL